MGNNNSATNIVNTLTENISNTAMNSLQVNKASSETVQGIEIDCGEARMAFAEKYSQCIDKTCPRSSTTAPINPVCAETAVLLCSALSPEKIICEATDTTLEAEVKLDLNDEQKQTLSSTLTNKITETITNTLTQEGSPIPFSDTNTYNNIQKTSKNIANIIMQSLNDLSTVESTKQVIRIKGGGRVQGVTLKSTKELFSKRIQTNELVQTQLNDLVTTLDNTVTVKGANILGFILSLFAIVIGVVVILITIGVVIKMMRSKPKPSSEAAPAKFQQKRSVVQPMEEEGEPSGTSE